MMNKTVQTIVAIVVSAGFAATAFWMLFAGTPKPDENATGSADVATETTAEASANAQPEAGADTLTPDLTKVSPYTFLDVLPVGKAAPDITLPTVSQGSPFKLSEAKGKLNTVVIFYQGSFCSVCAAQLENLQSHLAEFKKADAQIVAISADDKTHAQKTLGEHGLGFTVAYDTDKTVIKRYGVSNIAKGGISWPSAYIIDKQGVIRMAYAKETGDRVQSDELLAELAKLK
ncbi:MAG: peroxiredoxin family protein [Vampirovibrionales bacterium]|nr:peroxiredoxin family protein [Vampirovibrionales bacterium]